MVLDAMKLGLDLINVYRSVSPQMGPFFSAKLSNLPYFKDARCSDRLNIEPEQGSDIPCFSGKPLVLNLGCYKSAVFLSIEKSTRLYIKILSNFLMPALSAW